MSLGASLMISVNPPLLVVTITDCKLLIGSVNFLDLHLPHLGGTCTMLTTLWPFVSFHSLRDNWLGHDGGRALAEALKINQTLTSLVWVYKYLTLDFCPLKFMEQLKPHITQPFHWLCECCTLQWDCWPNSTWGSFRLSVLTVDSTTYSNWGVT